MKISIAIPESSLIDEATQLDKSRKIASIGRACAIFKVLEIFIYHDGKENDSDSRLLSTILKYMATPPFFRHELYPKMNLLKYSGVLYPLKLPNHVATADAKKINVGDIREGLVVNFKGKKFADIGINHLIPYFGKSEVRKRIAVQIKSKEPQFSIKEILREEVPDYWGYKVKEKGNLFTILSSWNGNVILTSRKGKPLMLKDVKSYLESTKPILVAFGSTEKGLHEILGKKINQIQNSKILNIFPNQATETVRLEEAILGTLSILNLLQTRFL